ncbi:hypothetical protein [Vreelandella sp. EE7]
MTEMKWPMGTLAVLTCQGCHHKWPANWKQTKALQEGKPVVCPKCHAELPLNEEQKAAFEEHVERIEKTTGKGSIWVTLAGLASFAVAIGYFFNMVPMPALVAVILPCVLIMFSSSSNAREIQPLFLALLPRHTDR